MLISVSDTGVGIPPQKAEKIFDAARQRHRLEVSRSIIESHDGQLWATPNDGRGATFHFTLPLPPDAAKVPSAET